MGTLIQKGVYDLWQSAPVPEWQGEGDPRQAIRIGDIMRMSSGLRFRAPQDPDFDPELGYPDHRYVYTGTVNSFEWAASKDQQWEPNTVGRYRNSDPVVTNYLVRLGVEQLGENYHEYPQRHLFDKLGIRNLIPETDPYGNFLLQGYEFGSGRDWARLGNLYLTDGVAPNGERLLPEGIRRVRVDAGARLGGGRTAPVRRELLLGEPGRPAPGAFQRVLHGGRGRTDHSGDSVARHGGGAPGSLQRQRAGWTGPEAGAGPSHGSGAGKLTRGLRGIHARQDSNLGPSA